MTSFATHRRRVHDVSRPPHRRLSALRTCLTEFAPYGFRATYHHLTLSAGIPARLEDDPGALVWAVEELHAARELWRAEYAARQVRRTVQKASGVRVPNPPEPARRLWCPDPEFHPDEPLHVVMPRILRTASGAPGGLPGLRDGPRHPGPPRRLAPPPALRGLRGEPRRHPDGAGRGGAGRAGGALAAGVAPVGAAPGSGGGGRAARSGRPRALRTGRRRAVYAGAARGRGGCGGQSSGSSTGAISS
ncbi:hypothetical protein ACWEPM_32780 [Streptomyces sp. NPDC004244]